MATNQAPQPSRFDRDPRSATLDPWTAPGGETEPDHHLWRNGRLWWIAFTVHLPGWKKERIRLSLGTADVVEARRRRDHLLREYPQVRGCQLSLRPGGRRNGRARMEGRATQPEVAA